MLPKEKIKEIERILIEYKIIDLKIENIEDRINMLSDDIKIANVRYEEKGSSINTYNSLVENEVIRREENISQLKNIKNELILFKNIVNRALSILEPIELDMIFMRYLHKDKKSWRQIGLALGFDEDYCCKKRKKIFIKLEPLLIDI